MSLKSYYSFILFICCHTFIFSQNCNDKLHTGEGTFYGGVDGGATGNCSLPVAQGDFFHCALNNIDYDGSNTCGSCIEVTGPKGSVTLKVVDRCPECASGDVDMTQEAFAMIADVVDGRVPISWKFVPCTTTDFIKINFKEGSSQYWTAIQFRDTKHAISKMEYQNTTNEWISVKRELFNFFIETKGIASPMNLRITSVLGEQLVFENIPLNLNADYDTGLQFTTPQECNQTSTSTQPDNADSNATFYPNPTSEILYLENTFGNWTLSDGSGKLLRQGTSKTIDMSELSNGLYFIYSDQKTIRIIKK